MTKKLLSIFAFLCLTVASAWAQVVASGNCGASGDNVKWELTGTTGNYTLRIFGTGDMASCEGVPTGWESYRANITSIVIEDGVTHIGNYAFWLCKNASLTSIAIPASVTSIGNWAFESCSGLTSLTIPANVTSIGTGVYSDCSNLATITVDAGNTVYDSRNNCNAIIETASNTLISGCKNTTFPDGLKAIGDYAFANCSGLTSITLPDGLKTIGDYAFWSCSGLTSITFPAGLKTIGDQAFAYCSGLTSITLPDGLKTIGDRAFESCSGLTSITFPDGLKTIESNAFFYCSGLTSITIPFSVTAIGVYAFLDCSHLKSVTVYAPSCSLDWGAFNNCHDDLKIFVLNIRESSYKEAENWSDYEEKIEPISSFAHHGNPGDFEWELIGTEGNYTLLLCSTTGGTYYSDGDLEPYKSGIKSVIIEDGVTSIGSGAFYEYTSLTSIAIPASVMYINSGAFGDCRNLASVTLNSNPKIVSGAFPDGVTVTMNLTANKAGSDYWMTFYNENCHFQADANTTVYKAKVNGASLSLSAVSDRIVTKGNAVILKSSDDPVMTWVSDGSSDGYSNNDLLGGSTVTDGYDAYTLAAVGGVVGFYKFTGASLDQNKAHLELPHTDGARPFYGFGEDNATAIESIDNGLLEPNVQSSMFNVQSEPWFTLDGRRLSSQPTQKGIYVKQGKKYIVK